MPKPSGLLPFSKELASADRAFGHRTNEKMVGFTEELTPAGFLGAATFAGDTITDKKSYVGIVLPKTLKRKGMTVTMWIKAAAVDGKRILIVSYIFYNIFSLLTRL